MPVSQVTELVANEVKDLVESASRLSAEASRADRSLGHDQIEELSSVAVRGGQLVLRLYGKESHYHQSMQKVLATPAFTVIHSNHYEHVSELVGILRSVAHDVSSGLILSLQGLLRAEIFADFLEMAEHLLEEGYKDASAVLLGAVLEDSLRKIADSSGLQTSHQDGKPFTIDPLNNALYKAKLYGPLVQKQITSWANLRNDAAHGRFSNYDKEQVKQMLLFVQKFCSDHLP